MSWKRFIICQLVFLAGWFLCALTGWFYLLVIGFVFPYAWAAAWFSDQLPITPRFFALAIGQMFVYGYVLATASTPWKFWKRILVLAFVHAVAVMAIGAIFALTKGRGF